MPFVRFSRDKRGYENTYLLHASSKKGANPRILYWYRTPPGVKVGRVAFDDVVRRTLEAQYPNVAFDWEKIADTPIPTVEVEPWRERRRAERAVKQARQAAARDDRQEPRDEELQGDTDQSTSLDAEGPGPAAQGPESTDAQVHEFTGEQVQAVTDPPVPELAAAPEIPTPGEAVSVEASGAVTPEASASPDSGRRRRRRGGRRRRRPGPPAGDLPPEPTE